MNAVWLVPIFALLLGGIAMAALLRTTADNARKLGAEIARFGELHVALARLRTEAEHSASAIRDLRER